MASLRPIFRSSSSLLKNAIFTRQMKPQTLLCVRMASDEPAPWNYIWRPELEPPTTPEQRAKAARKYGMIEEDYEPFVPDQEMYGVAHYGDYPNIKSVGANERDPYHNWDFPWLKRDFGEPMDKDFYIFQATRCDTGRQIVTPEQALGYFLFIYLTCWLIFYISPDIGFPMMNHQSPNDGKSHYTFEPAE